MKISDAISLINCEVISKDQPVVWADLGCGSGVFTQALASILPVHSTVYAIDRSRQFIAQPVNDKVSIEFLQADFENEAMPLPTLDGILMANSLHYIADKKSLIERLQHHFADQPKFIIVEYNTMRSNAWVPYPIDFSHMKKLFTSIGYSRVEKLAERPSLFGRGGLYGCLVC